MMADTEGFDGDQLGGGGGGGVGCFLPLLFSDDGVGLDMDDTLTNYTSSFSTQNNNTPPPKMLCFGSYRDGIVSETVRTGQKSGGGGGGVTCSDSSSVSSSCNNNNNPKSTSKSSRKRNGLCQKAAIQPATGAGAPVDGQENCKKNKTENPTSSTGHAKVTKVRKEKLGERVLALQQLVSPFGKTDTASVLHEAMGYIKFLQDQVQVLCSPYLQRLPSSSSPHHQHHLHQLPECGENGEVESRKDLRSRGLCLVPAACTVNVANTNGADYWSPAMSNKSRHSSLARH